MSWTPWIAVHVSLATLSLVLGIFLLRGVKGDRQHRVLGWTWVALMAGVALVSFAIQYRGFSWIHALSVWVLVSLVSGVRAARRHRVSTHRATMISLFFGALVIAGLFTLLPQRLLGQALWGWLLN